ncbi:MAG: hypothetical protein WC905_01070 [Patescibacteria group bacterium]|jgi:hypothetical protein
MDPLFRTLPQAVERVTNDFLNSPGKSLAEKISVATLAAFARINKEVQFNERQDLMVGLAVKQFYQEIKEALKKRANGQMVYLDRSFLVLSSASYGKVDFHESIRIILAAQLKQIEGSSEEKKEVTYGVVKNLVDLIRDTKTEKEDKTIHELLRKIFPNDVRWQEMIQVFKT